MISSSLEIMIDRQGVRRVPKGFFIGHASDAEGMTGVTVICFPDGARVGCDIFGGGPASRETPLCSPLTADNPVNAVVLSGGSAYGLEASTGVMSCLEEHGIGYDTSCALVPLVVQSCIYDLAVGKPGARPDAAMGRLACERALANEGLLGDGPLMGPVGAGLGATVGKICGMERCSASGLGIASARLGELEMTAVVVVNAFGDVYDPDTGKQAAGLRTPDMSGLMSTADMMFEAGRARRPGENTTLGCVITNAAFDKAEVNKLASMTRNAFARCIRPCATTLDGDSCYAASAGSLKADINVCGVLACEVMEEAILRAVGA